MIEIRDAKPDDAENILKIYDYYVKNTAVTFEYDTPSIEEFRQRMENIMRKYPYLVILKNGEIVGYAYANTFVARAAYDRSCELTIYLEHGVHKCGLGRKLYEALEKKLRDMGILNMYVCIGYPEKNDEYLTTNSADFHEHIGFVRVGEYHKCGYKFQNWYNMIEMEKIIGKHMKNPNPVINYNSLNKD